MKKKKSSKVKYKKKIHKGGRGPSNKSKESKVKKLIKQSKGKQKKR